MTVWALMENGQVVMLCQSREAAESWRHEGQEIQAFVVVGVAGRSETAQSEDHRQDWTSTALQCRGF